MDIGLYLAITGQSGDIGKLAEAAENLGYDSLWLPEHPVIPVEFKSQFIGPTNELPEHYRRWVDPLIALSFAAAATKRLKLGTSILLLPERHPIITAKEIAALDFYSGGRVILGVGAGWLAEETELMGARFATRWKLMREATEAMKRLWSDPQPSYQGDLIKFPPVYFAPKPAQLGGPPVLIGGRHPKVVERAGKYYDGWVPVVVDREVFKRDVERMRQTAVASGRDPDRLQVTALVRPTPGQLLTRDELKFYRDCGANRVVVGQFGPDTANGFGYCLEIMQRLAATIEHGQGL